MPSLVNTVQGTGATQPILVGGLAWANDLSGCWRTARSTRTTRSTSPAHFYNFNTCSTASCWDTTVTPVAAAVPVVTGKVGENDCARVHRYVHAVGGRPRPVLPRLGLEHLELLVRSGADQCLRRHPTVFGVGYRDHLAALATSAPAVSPSPGATAPAPSPTATTATRTPLPTATATPLSGGHRRVGRSGDLAAGQRRDPRYLGGRDPPGLRHLHQRLRQRLRRQPVLDRHGFTAAAATASASPSPAATPTGRPSPTATSSPTGAPDGQPVPDGDPQSQPDREAPWKVTEDGEDESVPLGDTE